MFDKLIEFLLECIGYIKFWRVIPMHKRGVRLRFGKHAKVLDPGFHFIWPFEITNVKTCIVEPDWVSTFAIHITTKDLKTISVGPTLKYRVIDTITWLYRAKDAEANLHDSIRLCASDVLTDCTWEECMIKPTWTKIKNKIKEKTKELGIEIEDFGLIDLAISRIIITSVNE